MRDGFGDNPSGNQADDCPTVPGTSTRDRFGCLDTDSDGSSDPDSSWTVANGADTAPNDSTQWLDTDGDGYGDNPSGTNGLMRACSCRNIDRRSRRLPGHRWRRIFRPRFGLDDRRRRRCIPQRPQPLGRQRRRWIRRWYGRRLPDVLWHLDSRPKGLS